MDTANEDASEEQKFTLKRITGAVWFFLCLFGALAAVGLLFFRLELPNWELYLQLGIVGGAASLNILGLLQLGLALTEEEPLGRLKRVAGFFLAIFGSLITLGRFFEVLKYPNHQTLMQLGLLGGAAALVVTGFLKLGEVFMMEKPSEDTGLVGEETREYPSTG